MLYKLKILLTSIFVFISSGLFCQITKDIRDELKKDSVFVDQPKDTIETSQQKEILKLDSLVQDFQLQKANLMMQLEQAQLQNKERDSLKSARMRVMIDSLRKHTQGIPVIVEKDTVFTIYANRGGNTPMARSESVQKIILQIGKKINLKPDSVYVDSTDIQTDIMYKGKVIVSVTDLDAMWADMSRPELVKDWKKSIIEEFVILKKRYSLRETFKHIGFLLLLLTAQVFVIILCRKLFLYIKKKIQHLEEKKLKPIKIKDYEVLGTQSEGKLLVFLANIGRYLLIFISLLISIPLFFSIFPQTEKLAYTIFHYILDPVKKISKGFVDYLPNLFTIIVIWLAVRYLVKGLKYLSEEIASGRMKVTGFYVDWARPSYQIIRFLLYAFMIAMIYPYLPGSDSKVFQGVSVFVGLIVSLGSSSVIANIMAGLVITYMRPFKIGDQIKLNDVMGSVIEKTPFVTRLRTRKNEIITIPNSFIMSSHTTNYSASARDYGLIIHTQVTIGYDAPWRKVHQLLIDAALATDGIEKTPEPFVLELSLNDWYPVYQINAYVKDDEKQPVIMSKLLENIQDTFNKAGVEIMSPTYIATRDGNKSTIPDQKD
ncbi:MAG: mechanosensitive ion channel family protein [Bacteroidales bacterium]